MGKGQHIYPNRETDNLKLRKKIIYDVNYIGIQNIKPSVFQDTFNSDPILEISSYFHDSRVHRGLQRLYLFGATSSCINIIIHKKNIYNL